jgi:WD40 repeat protein
MVRSVPGVDGLPPILAAPLAEYAREDDARLALWHACDAVEMALRLAVALGLGDWARAGGVPAGVRAEVARRLEQPTLGRWRGMALAIAAQPPPGTPLADLYAWVSGTLEPMLGGDEPADSLTELRNRLAHGGGLAHGLANELLSGWQDRLARAFGELAGLRDLKLVAPRADVVLGADDPAARAAAAAWAAGRSLSDDAVVAVRAGHVLPLWPLVAYSSPAGEPRAVPQVYVRRGEVRLVMTPLGAERAAVADSSAAAVDQLLGAGLLGDPPVRPPELEVAGFEPELKRDAGQCVGRDVEVARVGEALAGGPGLVWIWGPAGSGKSLVVARAVQGSSTFYFRFRAGDARCTRDTFLRFVVERAGTPPKGKPLREQARELFAAAKKPLVVDGIDDIAGIDPLFVADVLAPLAKVGRVVAAGRPEATVVAAMRTAGAIELFPEGLPAMTPADVRAMLLDKIGPLTKRLVALDREAGGGDVVNPFVEAVVARAGGLPVYVSYVIGDLLAGRIRTLDATALPPSLGAYHAAVLRRGGAGAAQQLVTPLVATLALVREPLEAPALHALMVHRTLATDDDLGRTALADALAQLAGMLRREDRDANGLPEYALFHSTLRDHVLGAPDQAMAVATARTALGRAARELRTGPALRYLDEHGVEHLIEAGDLHGAADALVWPRLFVRLARGAAALPGVLSDLRLAAEAAPERKAGAVPLAELYGFVRGAAHHVERGGAMALMQAALADADDSPITRAAEEAAIGLRPIRRLDRPARALRGARQRTMMGHAAPVRALVLAGDAIVTASGDGTLRVWDADDGSALRTLSPSMATFGSTTRAAHPAAPADITGTMPVLAVHALVAHDGAVLAAHGDGVIRRWAIDTGTVLAERRIHTYAWSLAVLGTRVAAACDDGVLRVLDARTLDPIAEARPAAATSGTGEPHLVAVAAGEHVLIAGGASRGLTILDPTSLTPLGELRGPDAPPLALRKVGPTFLLSTHRDGSLALWDVPARRMVARAAIDGGALSLAIVDDATALVGTRAGTLCRVRLPDLAVVRSAPVHAGAVAAVAALPDGRGVTGGADKAVRLVDLDVAGAARPSHAGAITALAAPSASLIVSGGADGAVKFWDARGRSLRTVPAHPSAVTALAALGTTAFSAAGTAVTEHRMSNTGAVVSAPLPVAPATVVTLIVRSPDELLAACSDGATHAWTRAAGWQRSGERLAAPGGALRAVSPDGSLGATTTRDDCVLFSAPDGTERGRWTCDAPPHALAFSDAATLVVGDAAGEIAILRLA